MPAPADLNGLVLAGGASSRMCSDKAALLYAGEAQLVRAAEVLRPYVAQVFISVRTDQCDEPLRASMPAIVDSVPIRGPMAGILSAFAWRPDVAWLVLACDLPFLTPETLAYLLAERDSSALATAYRSAHDAMPEPLCAIWEPAAGRCLEQDARLHGSSPRQFLQSRAVKLLALPDPAALDNVNTPKEYQEAQDRLRALESKA